MEPQPEHDAALGAVLALLVMTNYVAARHFKRWSISEKAQAQLPPLTLRVLSAVTNPVTVIVYYDKRESLYNLSYNLLKAYRYANSRSRLTSLITSMSRGGPDREVQPQAGRNGSRPRDLRITRPQKERLSGELSDIDIPAVGSR